MSKQTNSMWSAFGTDIKKERDGVIVEYPGGIRVTLARAGGRNAAFAKAHELHMRPHRNAMKFGNSLPEHIQREVIAKVYLDAVVKRFETNVGTDDEPVWKEVIVLENGDEILPTREHMMQLFKDLPDLLTQIISDANELSLYRKEELEDEAKN